MAAIFVLNEMCDGPIAKNHTWDNLQLCVKSHAFIVKCTIPSKYYTYLLDYLHNLALSSWFVNTYHNLLQLFVLSTFAMRKQCITVFSTTVWNLRFYTANEVLKMQLNINWYINIAVEFLWEVKYAFPWHVLTIIFNFMVIVTERYLESLFW